MKNVELDLYEEVMVLLGRSDLTNVDIAKGTGLSKEWVGKFKKGEYKNPGYYTLKRVRDYLEGAKSA